MYITCLYGIMGSYFSKEEVNAQMAKQKSGKTPKKKVERKAENEMIIRFRTADDGEAHDGLQFALKCGAGRVGSRTVSPNQVEAFAGFYKKAAAKEFNTWLQAKHKGWLVVDDSESGP